MTATTTTPAPATPTAAAATRPLAIEYDGPWALLTPRPDLDARTLARPLAAQLRRTYPNRAFPVALASEEAYQFSCTCGALAQQLREDEAA